MRKKNPFTIKPIREKEKFIGRKNLIDQVANMLSTQQCCHIVGERKSGKTSFLYRVAEEFKERGDMKFVFLDMQQLKPYGPDEILGRIACSIDGNLREEKMGYSEFEDFISDRKVILAFDEISTIMESEKIGNDFFEFLRAISNSSDVVYLTAHRENLYELAMNNTRISSPFFNVFRNFDLGYFTREESEELIQKGGKDFLNDYGEWIIDRAYHHPFLLQFICLTLFEYCKESKEDKESIFFNTEEEAYKTLESHFKYWYNKSPEDEKKILGKIVSRKGKISKDEENIAQNLEKRLLVYQWDDRYHLVSPFFKKIVGFEKEEPDLKKESDLNYWIILLFLVIGPILSYGMKNLLIFLVFYIGSIVAVLASLFYPKVRKLEGGFPSLIGKIAESWPFRIVIIISVILGILAAVLTLISYLFVEG